MKPVRPSIFAGATPLDGRGRRTNETLLRLDERDKMLIEIARRFFGDLSHLEAAHRLRSRLSHISLRALAALMLGPPITTSA